jgi:hypothetical protein
MFFREKLKKTSKDVLNAIRHRVHGLFESVLKATWRLLHGSEFKCQRSVAE